MRARFIGKDPASDPHGDSPTLFATDRADEDTFIVQGWRVTDAETLENLGAQGVFIEVPEEVLDMYAADHRNVT